MNCARCGSQSPDRAKFCLECGAAFGARCASCGTELPPAAKFCLECGAKVVERATPLSAPRDYTPKHLAEKRPRVRVTGVALRRTRRWHSGCQDPRERTASGGGGSGPSCCAEYGSREPMSR